MLLNKQTEASQKCGALSHFGSVLLFSFAASDTVDMSFKISVVEQLGKHVLHKCRNGTRIKAELFLIYLHKMPWENHITDTQGGRDGF